MCQVGKRVSEELIGRKSFSKSASFPSTTNVVTFKNQNLLDFIIGHARDDQRPYLNISILGFKLKALLDSGASRTVVGLPGWEILKGLGLSLTSCPLDCTVANGQKCKSPGFVDAPITLMDKTKLVSVLVVPELSHVLILGIDFWLAMNIVPNLRDDVWHFAEEFTVPELNGIHSENSLTPFQRETLDRVVGRKLALMGDSLGCCIDVEHEISVLPGTKPIKQRYYPVSPFKQKIIDSEIEKMLAEGIIEPSKSPWSSPVCLVPKKDNTYRFCVDFRQLNAVTLKDAYPLPYISAILDQLRDARYLSSIDIKSAYWQIKMKESSKDFTAFTVPGRGLYRFCRLPFGLSNAPATWQRAIDQILGADLQPSVLVYLDDIVIVSQDFETHLKTLETVLDRLLAAGLVVSPDKCRFCRSQLKYLGYLVDQHGLRPDPEKVQAILNISSPKNVGEVRRFLGTASWYRRFIPHFSTTVAPLTNLTKKNVSWSWSPECESSFRAIKEYLITAPVLTCPDFSKTFILQTDASGFGLGAVLTQQFEDGEHVISYLSRSLTRAEQKFSTTERECLAVIWAVEKLRHYLEGQKFVVITDHHSLLWLHRLRDPQGRLARWALRLQPYTFELIHRKGAEHIVPDLLSRSVPVSLETVEVPSWPNLAVDNTADCWYKQLIQRVDNFPNKYPQWRVESNRLFKYVKGSCPEISSENDNWKLVVPKDFRRDVLKFYHDHPTSGHLGIYKTYWRIHARFYWPKLRADVIRYINACRICAAEKPEQKRPAGFMGSRPPITRPWQMISLDYIGPFPRSTQGYTHVLVVTDYFSKYSVLFPCRSATAKSLVKQVEEGIFLVYGVPQYLLCDNGAQMKSREFQNLCCNYGVKIIFNASYNPRADPTERVNRVIKTMMASYVRDNHRHWDKHLAAFACALRTSRHEVTGHSPFQVNFGREHVIHGEEYLLESSPNKPDLDTEIHRRRLGFEKLFQKVRERIAKARVLNQKTYNLRRRHVEYRAGQQVWKRNKVLSDATRHFSAKLAPKFVGPYKVRKKTGYVTYELEDEDGNSKGNWHVQDLKPVMDVDDN